MVRKKRRREASEGRCKRQKSADTQATQPNRIDKEDASRIVKKIGGAKAGVGVEWPRR